MSLDAGRRLRSVSEHTGARRRPTALFVTASLDSYGSDLQMVQSAIALRSAGWRVVVVASSDGRSAARLIQEGVEIDLVDFPVLVRSYATPRGLAALGMRALRRFPAMITAVRRHDPDVVYVNTVTIPWWVLAGRFALVPTLCHVHEAEARDSRGLRTALSLPLLFASLVLVNSKATEQVMTGVVPRLARRSHLVYNGVETPPTHPEPITVSSPTRLVVVGRLSPRKAPQVAIEAVAILRGLGRDVQLDVCGTAAEGMEWFETALQERSERPDLCGAVRFLGYTQPIWNALSAAHIAVAPSFGESFGNAVVEAQLAHRVVVASAVQGHDETVVDGESGLLVPPDDPHALAEAVARLIDDPRLAARLAQGGRNSALQKFTARRYRDQIVSSVSGLARV